MSCVMKRTFSIPDIKGEITSSIKYSGGRGMSIIISGKTGYGHSEAIDAVEEELEKEGFSIFRGSSVNNQENLKYAPFNQIADQLEGQNKVRELSEIIRALDELPGDGKTVLVVEGLELSSDPTKFLFNYVSRVSSSSNFHIIGTLVTDYRNEGKKLDRFLKIIWADSLATNLELDKPKPQDFLSVTRMNGLDLPYGFIEDAFRLVDGNLVILDYVIRYYRSKGIIGPDGKLNEQVYRVFLIPGSLSEFYRGIIGAMNHHELILLSILYVSQYPTDLVTVSSLIHDSEGSAREVMETLLSYGLARRNGQKYSTPGGEVGSLIIDKIGREVIAEACDLAISSKVFDSLPLQARLNFHMEINDMDSVSGIIDREWKTFIRKFSSLDDLDQFISRAEERIKSKKTGRILQLVHCNLLFNSGKTREALAIYEKEGFGDVDPISVALTRATIYRELGKPGKAVGILDELISKGPLPEEAETHAFLTMAEAYCDLENIEQGEEFCRKALSRVERGGNLELEARAQTVLGNISFYRNSLEEAGKRYRNSIEINRGLGIWMEITRNLNNLAALEEYSGNYGEAQGNLEDLIDYTYLTGDATLRALGRYNLAIICDLLGNWDYALRQLDSAGSLSSIIGNRSLTLRCKEATTVVLMKMLMFRGAINEASVDFKVPRGENLAVIENLSRLAEFFQTGTKPDREPVPVKNPSMSDPRILVQYNMVLALYYFLNSDEKKAWETLNEAMTLSSQNGETFFQETRKLIEVLRAFFLRELDKLGPLLEKFGSRRTYLSRALTRGAILALSLANGEEEIARISDDFAGNDSTATAIDTSIERAMVAYYSMVLRTQYDPLVMDRILGELASVKPLKNYLGMLRIGQGS